MDIKKDQEILRRGERARQLLKDPLISEALTNLKNTVYHNIETSHYSKIEEREDLYKMLQAINGFEKQFKNMIRNGKQAETRLQKFFNSIKR
jgi:predicted ester cyclase